MSKEKERLAAILVNHWYVVEKALNLGIKKRHPASQHYSAIKQLDFNSSSEESRVKIEEMIKKFAAFNAANFVACVKTQIDTAMQLLDGKVQITWDEKAHPRGLNGAMYISPTWVKIDPLFRSLNHRGQHQEILGHLGKAPINGRPNVSQQFSMDFLIPGLKNNRYISFRVEEAASLDRFKSVSFILQALLLATSKLSDSDIDEIAAGRSQLKFSSFNLTNDTITDCEVVSEETESARNQRLAREAAEAARIRRTQKINRITMEGNTLTYVVSPIVSTEEVSEISINLDVVTGW